MAYSEFARGSASVVTSSTSMTPGLPAGTLTGKLLVLVAASSTNNVASPTAPSGWLKVDDQGDQGLAVYVRKGTASESAPTLAAFSDGCGAAQITAYTSSTGSWPTITVASDIVVDNSSGNPANGTGLGFPAHTVVGNGNMLLRVAKKGGSSSGETVSSVAVTSGYTQTGFMSRSNQTLGIGVAVEMLTAVTAISTDATANDGAFTTWAASRGRENIALELKPLATTTTISIDDATPSPGDAIVITKAEGAFVGTVQVELTDNNGAYVDVISAVTGSGATRTLTLPALATSSAVSAWDGADTLWRKFAWGDVLTLRVTDDEGVDTDTLTITPPVADHFDKAAGGSYDHMTDAAGTESGVDDVYVHVVSPGDGEGLPIISGFQGNLLPTTVHFMKYDNSADQWLAATVVSFTVAAAALTGTFADAFSGTAADLDAHTPDNDDVGTGWVVERDLSTKAAPAADAVNIDGSGYMVITDPNEGGTADIGVSDQDITVGFVVNSDANDWSLHGRRVDDTEHINVFVKDDGTVSINQRVASVGIGVTGTNSVSLGAFTDGTHIARLLLSGTSAKVYIDDVLQLDVVVVTANSSGKKAGIYSSSTVNGAGVKFDYINVASSYVAGVRGLIFGSVVA